MGDRLFIGAMSGTSVDGVDTALVRIGGQGTAMTATLLHHHAHPYSPALRDKIFALRSNATAPLDALAHLAADISRAYAFSAKALCTAARVDAAAVTAIAAHGQTLFHQPPLTLQWLDPALLAWETKCAVVSDFRRADCAAGGQGAPLVPYADWVLFRHPTRHRLLLNLGGIANITWLAAGGGIEQVVALDTGPGNCISDWICRSRGLAPGCDLDGAGAARGKSIPALTTAVLANAFFRRVPPKSTDTHEMIDVFARSIQNDAATDDLLATAAVVTATSIADAVKALSRDASVEVIASGGGVRNAAIMTNLGRRLGDGATLRPIEDLCIAAEAKEAVAFALLGAATLDGLPSNVPSATGASRPVVLGSITPAP